MRKNAATLRQQAKTVKPVSDDNSLDEKTMKIYEKYRRSDRYADIIEQRIEYLKQTRQQRKNGKSNVGINPTQAAEEHLWSNFEKFYRHPQFSYHCLNRIKKLRADVKQYENECTDGGKHPEDLKFGKLAAELGWRAYKNLRKSREFGAMVAEYENELEAEREQLQNTDDAQISNRKLERKLWYELCKTNNATVVLKHIKNVRDDRKKFPKNRKSLLLPSNFDYSKKSSEQTKVFTCSSKKIAMRIPRTWAIPLKRQRPAHDPESESFPYEELPGRRRGYIYTAGIVGNGLIYCDRDDEWCDSVDIGEMALYSGNLYDIPTGFFSDAEGIHVNGRYAVMAETSASKIQNYKPGDPERRICRVLIDNGEKFCLAITLEAKPETYKKRKQQFFAMLNTLKFTD